MCLLAYYLGGQKFGLGLYFNLGLVVAALLFGYHQYLIRNQDRDACFRAFKHNNWVGLAIFTGVVLDYAMAASANPL